MIPKIIHYCWFGGNPLPKSAEKCILSWKKYLPEYEIKEWNETNFDINIIPYTRDAYKSKKFAYVSDYARFWILYHYGGLYFDVDVEVIRPMDDIISTGPFMGCERNASNDNEYPSVNPGLGMAMYSKMSFLKEMMDIYHRLNYDLENKNGVYKTIVQYTTEYLIAHGLKQQIGVQQIEEITIYPKDFFNPLDHINQLTITDNTRSIHHYEGTWQGWQYRFYRKFIRLMGPKIYRYYLNVRKLL